MDRVWLFLFLAFFVSITVRNIRRTMRGNDLSILPRIEDEFRMLVVDNGPPELCFDGRTAEIVDDRQEGIYDSGSNTTTLRRVHRFARNAHGEYFFFMSEGSGSPYFKHLTQENAKAALGKKYIAPPSISKKLG
ncbi:MAG: hypothetical protein ACJ8GW_12900 [Massilia sp.]